MNSNGTKRRRRLCFVSPGQWSALPAMLTIGMLTGCASLSDLSRQQRSTSDRAGAKEFDPAMRERISRALVDADEQSLRATLDQQPENVNAAISLARALLAHNSSDEALQVLNAVLLATPGDLRALNAKGVVLDQQGRHEEAQVLYRQGLAIEPTNTMLRNNLELSAELEGKTGIGNSNQELQPGDQYALDRSISHSRQP
ncbi:tetratricopeptide repeat protein [Bradyrhizobium acaciae]|uniref:tetratricopeptide repeat protein n=1 Tax=Bradyrhizobium acaciae TaxID=2683706 RepID=UPI001E424F99|nr:tetratricopeptide repeat protein [Bradyrhizobium acaciae]MCC8978056.1 tetratricopeptide repeat protein [Bradyrhizobium acaciae]